MERVHAAISARVADKCSRVLGQELTEEEEQMHGDLVSAAEERGFNAWKKSKGFQSLRGRASSKSIVDACRAPSSKMVDAKEDAMARAVVTGHQGPGLGAIIADISGRRSLRSSHH